MSLPMGLQVPRLMSSPGTGVMTLGKEAIDLWESLQWDRDGSGRTNPFRLKQWQKFAINNTLELAPGGQFSALEVALIVARQNGKTTQVLDPVVLAKLFLFGDVRITHSAQLFKTARASAERIELAIASNAFLSRKVKRIRHLPGNTIIELMSGAVLEYLARSGDNSRGFTGSTIMLDEAYALTAAHMAAAMPTLSTQRDAQIIYASSAGQEFSTMLAALRKRAMVNVVAETLMEQGLSWELLRSIVEGLRYMEWSAPGDAFTVDVHDPQNHAYANPLLGDMIAHKFVQLESNSMPREEFAREVLSIWNEEEADKNLYDDATFELLGVNDPNVDTIREPIFSCDIRPDRGRASIVVAGIRDEDELPQFELVEYHSGTEWVESRLIELARHHGAKVAIATGSPAATILEGLRNAGVELIEYNVRDEMRAHGVMFDRYRQGRVRYFEHDPTGSGVDDIIVSVRGAKRKTLGEGWVVDRRESETDPSPINAGTLAVYAAITQLGAVDPLLTIY